MKTVFAAAVVAVLMSAPAFAAEPPWSPVEVSTVEDGKGGYKFTNDRGQPFYVNDKDGKGKIGCGEDCTGFTWLPVWARDRSTPQGDWSIVIRPDMSKQWAYKGVPIYNYNGDPDELEDAVKKDGHWKPLAN
jgi:predicted lipoprotein with Yx(FWY)xxD motif